MTDLDVWECADAGATVATYRVPLAAPIQPKVS
jgi:hypothetical protein